MTLLLVKVKPKQDYFYFCILLFEKSICDTLFRFTRTNHGIIEYSIYFQLIKIVAAFVNFMHLCYYLFWPTTRLLFYIYKFIHYQYTILLYPEPN